MIEYSVYSDHASVKKYTGEERIVVIPNTFAGKPVTEILTNAFTGNEKIETIVLPDILQAIHTRAFMNCVNLSTVTSFAAFVFSGGKRDYRHGLPALTRWIGHEAFVGCRFTQMVA